MKKRNLIAALLTVFAALFLGDQGLVAADPAVEPTPLPNGPLLDAGANFSAWQIVYSYASDKPSAGGKPPQAPPKPPPGTFSTLPPRTITVIRTERLWHSETIDTSGEKMDQWFDGLVRFFVENGIPPELPPSGSQFAARYPNFSAIGFPDMDWISPSTYLGTQTMNSRPCLLFSKGDMKAWINLETRFPVRWQRGDAETRTFRQLPPPTEMLTLPPDVIKASGQIKHDVELARRPVPT
jgi:hypothetical protein